MRNFTLPLVASLLAVSLAAQSETSPKGFLTTEGNGAHNSNFGYYTTAYNYGSSYLHVDATNVGQARNLAKLSLRRDGLLPNNGAFVARTIQVSLRMAHADYAQIKANVPQADSEFLLTPWTALMNSKTVNLPSLTVKPATAPAPFDIALTFDTTFAYDGARSLAFQILASPSSDLVTNFSGYPVDFHSAPDSVAPQAYYGTGCIATGNTQPMQHISYLVNYGPNSNAYWLLDTNRAPVSAPIATLIGTSNPNFAFGGCENLYVQPLVTLSRTTNSGGTLYQSFDVPHQPGFIGAQIYSQSVALDTAAPLGLALSQGMRVTYPIDPVQPKIANANESVNWSSPTWPMTSTFRRGASIVFGLH